MGPSVTSYDAVRAAAILAGEIQPMPDLLAHLGCSKVILNRWTKRLHDRRSCTDDELKKSCYVESVRKGHTVVSIQYDLCDLDNKGFRWSGLRNEDLAKKLRLDYCGISYRIDTAVG